MQNNILIVLEQLGIGGVETFVLNQVKALKKEKNNVFILGKSGLFIDKFKSYGATVIEYEFINCIYFDNKMIKNVEDIIKKYKITEVHINQFSAMNIIMSACLLTNTPYVVYLHMASGIIYDENNNGYNYFEKQFITYKKSFEILFKYAHKIIAITEKIKDYTAKRYNIDKNKMVVIHNSICFDEFKTNNQVQNIKNVFLISRLSKEKEKSVLNGIKLYKKLKEKMDVKLTIAGDGPIRSEIEEFIKNNDIKDVKFLGSISNVKEVMDKQDIVIGVDRCILEALTLEKIAIISGYNGLKGLVKKDNLSCCINENFCGESLNNCSYDDVVNDIIGLNKDRLKELITKNKQIIKKNLDINKNIFILGKIEYKIDYTEVIKDLMEISEILGKSQIEYYNKAEEIWKALKFYQAKLESFQKFVKKKYATYDKIINILKFPKSIFLKILKK